MTHPDPYTDADVELVVSSLPVDYEDNSTLVEVAHTVDGPKYIYGRPERLAATILDALAAAGRLPSAHHLPLLDLTADEAAALIAAAQAMNTLDPLEPIYGRDPLRSALDKLATSTEVKP